MGGFMGIGNAAYKTDRGAELGGRQGLWNVFNWALPEGQKTQAQGQAGVGEAQQYFSRLMGAGRTEGAALAAPALQSAQAQQDTLKRQEAAMGTGRAGGTTAAAREGASTAGRNIDEILASTLSGGRLAGAQGVVETGQAQLRNSLSLLGLGEDAVKTIMEGATKSRQVSYGISKDITGQWTDMISRLLTAGAGGGG